MNKKDFLLALNKELSVLPEEKKKKILLYYTSLFNGSDDLSEKTIILKLGNPKILAKKIINQHKANEQKKLLSQKKDFDILQNIKSNGILFIFQNYKFNIKNILIVLFLFLFVIFFILPALGDITLFTFLIFCVLFGILFCILCLPFVVLSLGAGLMTVSVFTIWNEPLSSFFLFVIGFISFFSSFFLSKYVYKNLKTKIPIFLIKLTKKMKLRTKFEKELDKTYDKNK